MADLHLDIAVGEFFSLLGPSGSGKTTTLRMLAGFERPSSGRVLLDGNDITDLPPYRRPVSTVFQSYALFPHMRVAQNVGYPLRMAGVEKAKISSRVAELLEQVAVTPLANRMPHQLSGGQRQRVALARALVAEPQVVLLDEPLGALDLKLRQEMQTMLQHLQREVGVTFVYVTHDQGEALAMSDQIAILHEGELHQVGSPEQVYSHPETAFVARFVGKTNLLECEADGPGVARIGDFRLRINDPPHPGPFAVSVRPEALRLGSDAAGCNNETDALVEEAIYQGAQVELRVRALGQTLTAVAPVGRHHPGETLRIGWNVDQSVSVATGPSEAESAA